jgi:alkyldihydroxyacetonephosphate synthase
MNVAAALAEGTKVITSANEADRVAYARDLWPRHLVDIREGRAAGTRPQAIAWPKSTEEVAAIVSWCAREGVPVVPYGAGSGVCGGILPDERTVVIDVKRMKKWRALDRSAPTLDVEAGAMGITLEEDLQRAGWTIGHFPSSILCSTVGGWVAARGAGQASGKYGKIEDMVVDLEVVDGRGNVARLRRRKSDIDLIPLIVGSEGTLGVITSAKMRLHPHPASRGFASFGFRTTEGGWEAMRAFFQAGLRPAVARLYDPFDAALARQGSVRKGQKKGVREIGRGAKVLSSLVRSPRAFNALLDALEGKIPGRSFDAMLVLVFDGTVEETADGVARARAIVEKLGGTDLGEGPAQNWLQHRYAVSYRQPPMIRRGLFIDTMEIASPWSKLKGLYDDVRAALGKEVFVMAHLSHAYPDGCSIYFTFAGSDVSGDAQQAKYDRTWMRALDAAIAAGGTLSHHHGVGRSKAPKMGAELGLGIDIVRALKKAFDPRGILNVGNLFPADTPRHAGEQAWTGGVEVDTISLLARATGETRLEAIEEKARLQRATLGLDKAMLGVTVRAWIEAGCPGAVDTFVDPVDHAIAGLDATIPDGRLLRVRPGPRRAVGPDLMSLYLGARARYGEVRAAHVRLHRDDAWPATTYPTTFERDPGLTESEVGLCDAIGNALRAG